jgi:hypothetical protein
MFDIVGVNQQADRNVRKLEIYSLAVLAGTIHQILHPLAGEFRCIPHKKTATEAGRKS